MVWLQRRVKNMLRNVAYLGDYYSHGTVCLSPGHQVVNRGFRDRYYIEEHHDPLVSRMVYDRVQQMLDNGYLASRMPMTEEKMQVIQDDSWKMGLETNGTNR